MLSGEHKALSDDLTHQLAQNCQAGRRIGMDRITRITSPDQIPPTTWLNRSTSRVGGSTGLQRTNKGLTFLFIGATIALWAISCRGVMPVLKRFGAVSIRMYADDHRPPHFHVVAPDFQVLVRISDLTVIAGEARATQIAEAMAWAQAHQEALALRWAELNERE